MVMQGRPKSSGNSLLHISEAHLLILRLDRRVTPIIKTLQLRRRQKSCMQKNMVMRRLIS